MATTNSENRTADRQRLAWIVLGALVIGFVVVLVLNLRPPPQMGPDEEVFNTVDALYTAVRNQDDQQLTRCEGRLRSYKEAGKLPEDSAEYLDEVITKARDGGWETAAKRLYDFMSAQRREGTPDNKTRKKGKGRAEPTRQ